jgi:hypothetical protein
MIEHRTDRMNSRTDSTTVTEDRHDACAASSSFCCSVQIPNNSLESPISLAVYLKLNLPRGLYRNG